MKTGFLKKGIVLVSVLAAVATLMTLTASAAPLKKDPAKGYATSLPSKNDSGVLVYEDFEKSTKDEEGRIGKFSATVPDDTSINPATIEIVSGVAHSGSKSLKVSARGKNGNGDPQGYNTVSYKNIGVDINEKFVKELSKPNKTDTYFISAWVRNVDPKVTQYFWLQLQYGGSGEVWLPGQTYFEVTGDKWTQIGIVVANDKTYYLPFTEDTTKSGIYAPRSSSTWSALKFITKNPKKDPKNINERVVQTNYDFYVDDIVIWKVDDASKLIAELPNSSETTTTSKKDKTETTTSTNNTSVNNQTTEPSVSETESTDAFDTTVNSEVTESTATSETQTGSEKSEDSTSNAGLIVLIVIASVIVLGGGFSLYWFKFRKTA
jgi:hypothetical protein